MRESARMPGTNIYLTYVSSRVSGYMSTVVVHLTTERLPADLLVVHVRLIVEGVESRQTLTARPSLNYTFYWNRLNAYRQKVYGLVTVVSTSNSAIITKTIIIIIIIIIIRIIIIIIG